MFNTASDACNSSNRAKALDTVRRSTREASAPGEKRKFLGDLIHFLFIIQHSFSLYTKSCFVSYACSTSFMRLDLIYLATLSAIKTSSLTITFLDFDCYLAYFCIFFLCSQRVFSISTLAIAFAKTNIEKMIKPMLKRYESLRILMSLI